MIITNPLSFKAYQSGGSIGKASLEIISPSSCTYGGGYPLISMQGNSSQAVSSNYETMSLGVCPFIVFGGEA